MALRVEMSMDRGMDRSEFLQGSQTCVASPLFADLGRAAQRRPACASGYRTTRYASFSASQADQQAAAKAC